MTVKTIKHAMLGELMPVQGPFATYFSPNDDFDLGLYIDGPVWLVKLELDYLSRLTGALETIEKEFALDAKYLDAYGRARFTAKYEELYDTVANTQLEYISLDVRKQIRNAIMDLMAEAYLRLDRGEKP
jgi:hypothetical protein